MSGCDQPRWGNLNRDRKAAAIMATMSRRYGDTVFDGNWIDIGCGSGGIAMGLATRARSVLGVDPEPWQQWSTQVAASNNVAFRAARFDAVDLPVCPASFDIAVCNQVYEHVEDPKQLVLNIKRVLVPGGRCYFAGPNLLWPIEPHVFWPFVHWMPRGAAHKVMRFLGSNRADQLDANLRNYWALKRWFEEAGFAIENALPDRIQVEFDLRMGGLSRIVPKLPRSFWDIVLPIAPGFVFVLRKC